MRSLTPLGEQGKARWACGEADILSPSVACTRSQMDLSDVLSGIFI